MAERRTQELFINGIPVRQVRLFGQDDDPVEVDRVTNALISIDTVHARVHEGVLYVANRYSASLADDASITLLLRPNGAYVHLRAVGVCGGDAELFLSEGPTVSGNGTEVSTFNKNRVSANVATMEVFHTPTLSADGTELLTQLLAGGSGIFLSPGAQSGFEQEWVLDPDTDYVVRLTNVSGSNQPAELQLDFYEG